MQTKRRWTSGLVVAGFAFAGAVHGRILVQVPAVLDQSAPIAESVKRECDVENLVGTNVSQQVREQSGAGGRLAKANQAGLAPFLKLTILAVNGIDGGRKTGSKDITVRADMLVNGQIAASKEFTRGTSSSIFYSDEKNTCELMETISASLGKDILKWLPGQISAIPAALPNRSIASSTFATGTIRSEMTERNPVSQHRKQVPYQTNFAVIDDVVAVPVNENARALYRQYLTLPSPKAFVVYLKGEAKAYSNDPDVMTTALDTCTDEVKSCWLYAVDDRVVWTASEGTRIGLSARLRKR